MSEDWKERQKWDRLLRLHLTKRPSIHSSMPKALFRVLSNPFVNPTEKNEFKKKSVIWSSTQLGEISTSHTIRFFYFIIYSL